MILQDKCTGGKKVLLERDEITLENIKNEVNFLCKPNIPYNERRLYATFPYKKPVKGQKYSEEEMKKFVKYMMEANYDREKLYEVLADEVIKVMKWLKNNNMLGGSERLPIKENKEIDLTQVRFSEVFIQGLGNLEIENR